MKKLSTVLMVFLIVMVAFSVAPPASARNNAPAALAAETKYVWVIIRNQTNRYVTISLDHQTMLAIYYKQFAPGSTDMYLPVGRYAFKYYACGRYRNGTFEVKSGKVFKISCPKR